MGTELPNAPPLRLCLSFSWSILPDPSPAGTFGNRARCHADQYGVLPMKFVQYSTVACVMSLLSAGAAYADDCSGRDHTTGTVLGAAGGAAIGGVASHDAGGAIAGAVLGGLAGNAIARSQDCNRQTYEGRTNDQRGYGRQGEYGPSQQVYSYQGYNVAPDENDYWGVESHEDFDGDYNHISASIQRGREDGTFTPYQARRYTQQLQQVRARADYQERRGQFDPQDIQDHLTQLRRVMYVARQDNRYNTDNGNYGRR